MKKILLTTLGSHGDLHPYLGMAKVLKEEGYNIVLSSHPHFEPLALKLGVDFLPIKPSYEDIGTEDKWANQANHPTKSTEFIVKELFLPYIKYNYEKLLEQSENTSLIISHFLSFATPLVAEKKNIPWLSCVLQPSTFMSSQEPPILAPLPFLPKLKFLGPTFFEILYKTISKVSEGWFYPLNNFKEDLGLNTDVKNPLVRCFSPHGTLAMFDELFHPVQKDCPQRTFQIGFPFFDQDTEENISKETVKFLDSGESPIIFTLGTAIVLTDTPFFEIAYNSIKETGERAIFLIGKKSKPLPDYIKNDPNIHLSTYEPFSQLFIHGKIIVHQCGIGTTAQALLSGKPQILVPFSHDQPDNARIVSDKGIGINIPVKKLSTSRLISAIETINKDSSFSKNAINFSQNMDTKAFEKKLLRAVKEYI